MQKMRLPPGLCPGPHWRSLQRSPKPPLSAAEGHPPKTAPTRLTRRLRRLDPRAGSPPVYATVFFNHIWCGRHLVLWPYLLRILVPSMHTQIDRKMHLMQLIVCLSSVSDRCYDNIYA